MFSCVVIDLPILGKTKQIYHCSSKRNCTNKRFDRVYSYRHALDIGWTFYTDEAYCPECSKTELPKK